ncbi:MAG: transcriptional repressor LexA [Candidatus Treponema excrementipullorum]|uniref:LexA repressor n=1 Tax=Candidatus Treponema excrementipullorum TaxID=2838768 RepID=A0A9E2L0W9_9SPIR|nr:transcriptional repressor LexA [Candidatus Treponema excrementipullorum]MCI6479380.1 transcriptional repressor LexA [Spirochaetia bacterium]MCI6953026.1 transcriptional repressor LexA [Spirochaetia bacterium]MCI7589246.1 transcriptional repressor LexA [Spirochaetia bacterium]MDD7011748.1 transcriptional repressor LexA [Candidatus Treponema excrementipullorum]
MKELTRRQIEILNFVRDYSQENLCPPTIRECSSHFGITPRAVQCHFSALQKKGYLSQSEKRSRSVRVLMDESGYERAPAVIRIPILGTVAAGKPLLCEENLDGYLNLSEPFVGKDDTYFALKVRGNSMIDAGIFDGDIAVIRQQHTANNGEIVVAVLDEAITLKRFFKESCRIRLQPENPAFKPIYCQNVQIAGVLASLIRTY